MNIVGYAKEHPVATGIVADGSRMQFYSTAR